MAPEIWCEDCLHTCMHLGPFFPPAKFERKLDFIWEKTTDLSFQPPQHSKHFRDENTVIPVFKFKTTWNTTISKIKIQHGRSKIKIKVMRENPTLRSSEEWAVWEAAQVQSARALRYVRRETAGRRRVFLASGLGLGGRSHLGPGRTSGAQGELVLLNGLFDPGAQAGLVEGLDQRLLGRVVLCGGLLGVVVGARLRHFDPQDGRQLRRKRRGEVNQPVEVFSMKQPTEQTIRTMNAAATVSQNKLASDAGLSK